MQITISSQRILKTAIVTGLLGYSMAGGLPFGLAPFAMAVEAVAAPSTSTVTITADHQTFDQATKKYNLNGNVVVKYKDYVITSTLADMDIDAAGEPKIANFFKRPRVKHFKPPEPGSPSNIKGTEDNVVGDVVRIFLNDNIFGAEGNVESHITTVAADPFTIRSDVQQIDNNQKTVTANGQVRVEYQGSTAYSSNALMRMNQGGKAERVIFTGGARLVKDTSEVTGERITLEVGSGNMYAENTVRTRVDLKDNQSGPDQILIYSDYQNYDKASDKMLASGHVKIIYGDYVATGPRATFNLQNGNVKNILLTGRPTIIEKARKVTADKITITTTPKNFDAVGNVKTQFQSMPKAAPAAPASATPAKEMTKGPKTTTVGKATGKTPPVKKGTGKVPANLPQDNPLDYQ